MESASNTLFQSTNTSILKGSKYTRVTNSVSDSKRRIVSNVYRYTRCKSDSSSKFGIFCNSPAIYSRSSSKMGKFKAINGGLLCIEYLLLRCKLGNSNPIN